ncbi:hypothetical protein R1sor_012737 [Riccia sorocarpa]|uniref:RING-CH-type domain-containing protein n=1 Tax=Riccia sorocarpa TaxID=122646 RepID=A0ABD3I5A3_9MARC
MAGNQVELNPMPDSVGPNDDDAANYCRICAGENPEEPHVELACHCQGQLARVHPACLERWFGSRRTNICDICRHPITNLPDRVLERIARRKRDSQRRTIIAGICSGFLVLFALAFQGNDVDLEFELDAEMFRQKGSPEKISVEV